MELLTPVEVQILRNQLASMRVQIHMLTGLIDATSNRDRDNLRTQILKTAKLLGIREEEVFV